MKNFQLFGDKTDLVLIHTALTDLIEKIHANGDQYQMAINVGDLIEQVEYINANWDN